VRKKALVVGLGIAGMSAAIGLRRAGWTPVVVERAPQRRTGGYFVFLFPEGVQAAAELGITDHLHTRNPEWEPGGITWSFTRRGRRKPALGFLDLGGAAVLRGDVEAALWRSISAGEEPVEVRFATTPLEITERNDEVEVLLAEADTGARYREGFDLVVGADGLRSSVRRMVFGPDAEFLTDWNAMICAFQLPEQVPSIAPSHTVASARAKRAVWVFGFGDHPPTALLTYCTDDVPGQFAGSRIERLREVYAGMDDPVVRHVLDCFERAPEHLFDSVHQVKLPRWSRGRVVLTGDAAWCMTTYSGMGASSAMRGGAALATALQRHPDDLGAALAAWETGLRPFITGQQNSARVKQQRFVPTNRLLELVRALVLDAARRVTHRRIASSAAPRPAALPGAAR